MSTIKTFKKDQVNEENSLFSSLKTIVETTFYGNNVSEVDDLKKAYELVKNRNSYNARD